MCVDAFGPPAEPQPLTGEQLLALRPKDDPDMFTREELCDLRRRALSRIHPDVNDGWARAFQRLADAADILDAFYGRSFVCPSCFPVTPPDDCKSDQAPESVRSPAVCSSP